MASMTATHSKFYRLIRASGVFDAEFYLANNSDVRLLGIDPLQHYVVAGESEKRAPCELFDPEWYRQQKPNAPKDFNLLAHYLTVGDKEGFQPFPGFDPEYVRQQVPSRKEPTLVSYLSARRYNSILNPNRFFDQAYYRETNPDVAQAKIDPYYHFVLVGADEGRLPSRDFSWFELREKFHLKGSNSDVFRQLMLRWRTVVWEDLAAEPSVALLQDEVRRNHRPGEGYEHRLPPPMTGNERAAEIFAFYLTQFHRVAENDSWWGEGFTEWHNVVRGLPRFSGHYQPRIPALGFYDLEDPRTLPAQVAMAKQAGISGFAFYYYNFGNHRLLEKPLERFLGDSSLDMQYFLIWANETWSRRWDGSESEVLLEQTYPDSLVPDLADDLVRHFADPRYKRIGGRPLLVIYRVAALPRAKAWVQRLRRAFLVRGHDPLIYMAQTFEDVDPGAFDLDGAMEFPPHKHSRTLQTITPDRIFGHDPALRIWDYDSFVEIAENEQAPSFPLIRTCFPSWDNDSRRQGASAIVHGSTPEKFARWLSLLMDRAESEHPDAPIVCINAWNEWGEGAYLEPDRHWGHAYLNVVQRLMHPAVDGQFGRVALVGHDAFGSGAQRLLLHIGETLRTVFNVEIAFVLLNGSPGYDAMLASYAGVAPTMVVGRDGTLAEIAAQLAGQGFHHAIVNTSAAASALEPLVENGMVALQLIHELPEMFASIGTGPTIAALSGELAGVVAPSFPIAEMLADAGVEEDRILVRQQGLYRPLPMLERGSADAVVGLGYADRRKGIDLFVAACAELARRGQPTRFIWQGDWDPTIRGELAQESAALMRSGLLTLLPYGDDVAATLAEARAFFLSSREDPLPVVAMEAWASGIPVVAFAGTGGIADLLEANPELGEVAPDLTVKAAADALSRAMDEARDGARDAARAQFVRRHFDWTTYCGWLLQQVYELAPVDVAIVGYGHGAYAASRIDSVLAQTLPPNRIVYADMGSPDGSADKVADWLEAKGAQAARVDLVRKPPNGGRLWETWLELAKASTAEFLHIAEGDDAIAPTMLERCVLALEDHPEAAFAFTAVRWVGEEGHRIADHLAYPASVFGEIGEDGVISSEQMLASDLLVKNPILSVSSVVWHRARLVQLIEANRHRLQSVGFAFDWVLYLAAAEAGDSIVFIPECLCQHRQHDQSFAARSDLPRHAEEIAGIHALFPSDEEGVRLKREAYLAELAKAAQPTGPVSVTEDENRPAVSAEPAATPAPRARRAVRRRRSTESS